MSIEFKIWITMVAVLLLHPFFGIAFVLSDNKKWNRNTVISLLVNLCILVIYGIYLIWTL